MSIFNKTLLGATLLLGSASLFACPQISGYHLLRGVNANPAVCKYVPNKLVVVGLKSKKVCPRFILTDPHFKVIGCKHSPKLGGKCVCKIRKL